MEINEIKREEKIFNDFNPDKRMTFEKKKITYEEVIKKEYEECEKMIDEYLSYLKDSSNFDEDNKEYRKVIRDLGRAKIIKLFLEEVINKVENNG